MLNHLQDVTAERREQLKMSCSSDEHSDDMNFAKSTERLDNQVIWFFGTCKLLIIGTKVIDIVKRTGESNNTDVAGGKRST